MKRLLLFALLFTGSGVYAQDTVDTLYYNKAALIARNTLFADYYRVALYPADTIRKKEFKDFYSSGELLREGYFQIVDSLDDCCSIFDGEIRSYFKNGNISEIRSYSNGRLHGEYLRYSDDGALKVQTFYSEGKLSGTSRSYNDDGTCQIVEYYQGKPISDYYLLSDRNGNTLKFRISDDTPVWESPAIAERFVDYRDAVPWEIYFKNGITLALTNSIVKDYGKWHRIHLILSNHSLTPIEFTPENNITAYSADAKNVITDLQVWSCDAYMKKVNRAQTWAAIAIGLSEGLSLPVQDIQRRLRSATAVTEVIRPIQPQPTMPLKHTWPS